MNLHISALWIGFLGDKGGWMAGERPRTCSRGLDWAKVQSNGAWAKFDFYGILQLTPQSCLAMPSTLIDFCGWLPAVIIPTATLLQLMAMIRQRSAAGVDWLTWLLFGIANVGLYIYTEKYGDLQSVVGLLGSAVMDFAIATLVLANYGMPISQEQDP